VSLSDIKDCRLAAKIISFAFEDQKKISSQKKQAQF
jgi:hypothetical protein